MRAFTGDHCSGTYLYWKCVKPGINLSTREHSHCWTRLWFTSFDIKFTRLGFENACWIERQSLAIQQAFTMPYLVNLISKDTHLVVNLIPKDTHLVSLYIWCDNLDIYLLFEKWMRPGLFTNINGERSVAQDRKLIKIKIVFVAFNKSLIKIVINNKSSGLNYITRKPGPEAIKLFHAHLSMKFQMLMRLKCWKINIFLLQNSMLYLSC